MVKYRLKKLIIFTIILFTFSSIFSQTQYSFFDFSCTSVSAASNKTKWPGEPSLYGKSAILMDASTGTILYEKKCYKKMYPASITKIMTALLAIENCNLNDTVEYSKHSINSLVYGDANIACQIGEKMSVKDCLYALMLSSANETATALGEHIAGSIDKFSDMMNQRAAQAGADGVHFKNANGLHDPNHYVTAYGMAMIMKDALQYQVFKDIINTEVYTIPKNNKRHKKLISYQRHKMVRKYSGLYYDGIIGGKTGYTDQSGTTLVTSAEKNGMTLITVVLNSNGDNVYKDTKALLDYGFTNFQTINVSENESRFQNNNSQKINSPFTTTSKSIYIDEKSTIIIPKKVKLSDLSTEISYGLSDDSFASITYKYGDRQLGTAKIKYAELSTKKNNETNTTLTTDTKKNSENLTTKSNIENKTTAAVKSKDSKKTTFHMPKILLPIIFGIVVLIIIIVIVIFQRRKINKIRTMKRQRNR